MAVHDEVLRVARRIGRARKDWTFRPDEIVSALPGLNPSTIRTHVTSRCCVNAPQNHPHKWDYFLRLSRGVYQVRPKYRGGNLVRESPGNYEAAPSNAPQKKFSCEVRRFAGEFHAHCSEAALAFTAGTLDAVVAKLRDALSKTLASDDTASLVVTFQEPLSARSSLDALVRRITASNRHSEVDWGPAVGRESW